MKDFKQHLLSDELSVIDALKSLDRLAIDAILFLINSNGEFIGSLTDGDIRRGFIRGLNVNDKISEFVHSNPIFIYEDELNDIERIIKIREMNIKIVPIINSHKQIVNIINFRKTISYLPVTSILMAGGKGERLGILTKNIPKPLLKIGDKQIIDYNIENMIRHGIMDINITVNYLADQIVNHISKKNIYGGVKFECIREKEFLGTIGSVRLIKRKIHENILIMNSDIFSNINFEDFYLHFIKNNADISVASVPYHVTIPYAVLEIGGDRILGFEEKPSYTFYSNAGIYLMKKEIINMIPEGNKYDATDLIQAAIDLKKKVTYFPVIGYWIDIGKPEDYKRAQDLVNYIKS